MKESSPTYWLLMTFSGFGINLSSRSVGEARLIDERMASQTDANVTIEDKVTSLFEALRKPIFSYLVAVFGKASAVEAEDITQEAFMQLYRALRNGTQIDNSRAWLFRVAHNLAINRLKASQFIAPLDDLEWEAIVRTNRDPGLSPEQRTQRMEEFARVYEALKRLTLTERQCLHLRAKGLRYKDIAHILDLSVPSVGKALRQAIRKLIPDNGT